MTDVPVPVPPAPPPPAASRLRRGQPRRPRGFRRVWLLALAVFAAIVIAMYGRKPEGVTYGQALEFAAIMEQAQTAAEIRPLLDVRVSFADPATGDRVEIDRSDDLAEFMASYKVVGTLTFIRVQLDDRDCRTLLFRVHRAVRLVDYCMLRVERRTDAVRATGIYSLALGGWVDRIAEIAHRNFTQDADLEKKVQLAIGLPAEGPFPEVPVALQRTLPFATAHLVWLSLHDAPAFPAALAQFRQDFPGNGAADLVVVNAWETLHMKPEEAIAAIDTIEAGHVDPDFCAQLREKVWQ